MSMPALVPVPSSRVRAVNDAPTRPERSYVLYWMIATRRMRSSFALDHAARHARALGRPLLVFEALRAGYRWASARHHRFIIAGMADNARECAARGVTYLPYVEPRPGAGKGLLAALAARAAVVVTDDYPASFLPAMVAAAGRALDVRLEQVDGNGLLPMRQAGRAFPSAYAFRRFLQSSLEEALATTPSPSPLAGLRALGRAQVEAAVARRWPAAELGALLAPRGLAHLPIDPLPPAREPGGSDAAHRRLDAFVAEGLKRYADERNHPDREAASALSSYLHHGQIGTHEVLAAITAATGWDAGQIGKPARGQRAGFWNAGPGADAFLDQLVTWRELGYGFAAHRPDHDRYESLPFWARETLERHAADPRAYLYSAAELEAGQTHDALWNAAARELHEQGRIHNYMRMLWGKKVIEWSRTPEQAWETLVHLNNKYALDGRDPNSYSGIAWCFGRFDRPWGPRRPVFGTVRFMSTAAAARKLRLDGYLARHGGAGAAT